MCLLQGERGFQGAKGEVVSIKEWQIHYISTVHYIYVKFQAIYYSSLGILVYRGM